MIKNAVKYPKGVLHPTTGEQKFTLLRYEPSLEAGYFVKHYWIVRWDLRFQEPHTQTVIAHPNVNLVFEKNNTRIYGVAKSTSMHLLQQQGWVIGIKFKPGGFYPFFQEPVSTITGKSLGIEKVFGIAAEPLEAEILNQTDDEGMVARVESFLVERLPERDPNVELVSSMVTAIQEDRSIMKVEDAVRLTGINKRTMQRLFDRYVGVSPKSVIQRYRLHEAAVRIDQGEVGDWLDLSTELGYYDHSHFIRDFRAVVGLSPEEYRKSK